MLIEFAVENYKSIKERHTFSMIAANLKKHEDYLVSHSVFKNEKLLKVSACYGPNAAGKSNVVNALACFHDIVVESGRLGADDVVGPYTPFVLDNKTAQSPTSFSMEFICNGMRYLYEFSYNKDVIVKEGLYFFPTRKAKLFERNGDSFSFGQQFKGDKKAVEKMTRSNNLFLSRGAELRNETLEEVHKYIKDKIIVYGNPTGYFNLFERTSIELLLNDEMGENNKKISELLSAADVGVKRVGLEKSKREVPEGLLTSLADGARDAFLSNTQYFPVTYHDVYHGDEVVGQEKFLLQSQESSGTQKLFYLAKFLLNVLNEGGVLIVDELDNSMHTFISEFIIDLFNKEKTNPNNAQLLFTTHDVAMLTPDNFRKDQVWFASKNEKGESEFYSLVDFDSKTVRNDTKFDKWYRDGRFGAIPFIKKGVFEKFFATESNEGKNGTKEA